MSDSENPPDSSTPDDTQHVGKSSSPVTAGKSATRRELLAALTATDVTIRRLDLLLSSADGQERVLATVNYVASILHHLCASAPWIAFQMRLGILARLRVISNVIYQFLENVPYLASKGIISKTWINKYGGIDLWYIWSTRGWFGHIFFQFFVLWRENVLRKRRMAAKCAAAGIIETKELKAEEKEELRKEIRSWKKSLVNNTIWAPLCVHWCFEKGIGIPENLIGLFSLMAGAWGLRDSWAATAKA
ncbi:Peroxisomal biogenesis factor 11 [Penicillium malachiteum]|uniref:Peroxisomal biogenesis factor 11 n=1 Tax=Penicillium malachiteum TaxID=1324776 RepID=UPI002546EBE5|nr:Peroxisomal biogenesis factor 11 [Penicillium malachiteum]KAJ5737044.1 Peroxisomal biogenesis factor 11 [Penicillium malachiteum]